MAANAERIWTAMARIGHSDYWPAVWNRTGLNRSKWLFATAASFPLSLETTPPTQGRPTPDQWTFLEYGDDSAHPGEALLPYFVKRTRALLDTVEDLDLA